MNRAWVLIAAVGLAACTSPEAERVRGGGPGADKGNRGDVVLMHEGSKPFAGTPRLVPTAPPPLAAAEHAHLLSTNGDAAEATGGSADESAGGQASGAASASTSAVTGGSTRAE